MIMARNFRQCKKFANQIRKLGVEMGQNPEEFFTPNSTSCFMIFCISVLTYIGLFNTLICVFSTDFLSYISCKICRHFTTSMYDYAGYEIPPSHGAQWRVSSLAYSVFNSFSSNGSLVITMIH